MNRPMLDHLPWTPGQLVYFPEPDDIEVLDAMSKPGRGKYLSAIEALRIARIEANVGISKAITLL